MKIDSIKDGTIPLFTFIVRHWFEISVLLILILAIFLRFYNYENRWGLAYDQAHDAVIARYALETYKFPLVGPFSSAGPFQTGGEWYWFIMAATALYPNSVLTPWIVLTLLSVVFVFLMMALGIELIDKRFGILIGLLSAVSTAQIAQSTNLTNQSLLAIPALFAIWSAVTYLKKGSSKSLFFLGLSIALTLSIHLQGGALLLLIPMTLFFTGIPSKKGTVFLLVGLILPLLPLFLFDLQNDFTNLRGILQYYLHDQYKVSFDVLGRRWLTYAGVFWPNSWAHVIGGQTIISYFLIVGLGTAAILNFIKKAITKEWYIIILSFLAMISLIRYIRTPLFDSYIVFLHPFILLLTGWIIFTLSAQNKIAGFLLLTVVVLGSMGKNLPELRGGFNYTPYLAKQWKEVLVGKFTEKKFAVYDLNYARGDKSLPLVLFLDVDKKIDDRGLKIGITIATSGSQFKHPVILGERGGYQIFNLNSSTSAQLSTEGWAFVNPSQIYHSTQEWYIGKNL